MDPLPNVWTPQMMEESIEAAREKGAEALTKIIYEIEGGLTFVFTADNSGTACWEILCRQEISGLLKDSGLDYFYPDELAV